MNKIKIILALIILGILGLFFYQNNAFFLARHSLGIDVFVAAYRFPEVANGLFFLGCLVIGMLVAYLAGLAGRFEAKRAIRDLNNAIEGHLATIASLQNELAAVKQSQVAEPPAQTAPPADLSNG